MSAEYGKQSQLTFLNMQGVEMKEAFGKACNDHTSNFI